MKNTIGLYVNNWIFGARSLQEVVERVADIGFDGIELVGEPTVYEASQVRVLLADHGLKVISVCGMYPGPQGELRALSHPDSRERQAAISYIYGCVDLAKEIGARSVLVVPSLVGYPQCFVSRKDDLARATESLSVAGEYAKEANILLTIEPINRYEVGLVFSLQDAIDTAKESGQSSVRVMGDTFHMQIEEKEGIPNAIRRAGRHWFQHLHVADNTREAPGLGTMPWREVFRALLDIDYEGGISCEPLPRGASPYDARAGNIPADLLDAQLRFALEFLSQEQVAAAYAANKGAFESTEGKKYTMNDNRL